MCLVYSLYYLPYKLLVFDLSVERLRALRARLQERPRLRRVPGRDRGLM